MPVESAGALEELQAAALSSEGVESFLSEPVYAGSEPITVPAISSATHSAAGEFVALEQSGVSGLSISAEVPADGRYAIAFRYANGSGPVNTGSRCAIRSLFIDGHLIGPVVLPQRGTEAWNQWGWSSIQVAPLAKGKHIIELRFLPSDVNMDGAVNTVRIQSLQVKRIE